MADDEAAEIVPVLRMPLVTTVVNVLLPPNCAPMAVAARFLSIGPASIEPWLTKPKLPVFDESMIFVGSMGPRMTPAVAPEPGATTRAAPVPPIEIVPAVLLSPMLVGPAL